jgi:hypothetical protein
VITIDQLLTDPRLLGEAFAGSTWDAWRALLAGAFALPMTDAQRATFHALTERDPPSAPVRELWIVAGRRSGKSRIAAALGLWAATCCKHKVSIGEVPVVLHLAADREQARVLHRYASGMLAASPVLAQEVAQDLRERIELRNGVELQIATSDYRAVRGRTVIAALLDEVSFWEPSIESVNPDTEVYSALKPALATQQHSLLVGISSPYAQRGLLYEQFRRYFGSDDSRVLVARAPTELLNPSIDSSEIADAIARDPVAASAEWLAQFRSDLASFIDSALVDSLTRSEPRELPWRATLSTGAHTRCVAGLDVSGGRGDATAAAIAHLAGDTVVIDAVRRWPAPHDPAAIAQAVAEFLQAYKLTSARADQYAAGFSRAVYSEAGVTLVDAPDTRSESYLRLLPLLTTGRVELPPDPTLRMELLGLERRTSRGGRDSVDHRPGAHDDVANACALAAVAASRSHAASTPVFAQRTALWDDHAQPEIGFEHSMGWLDRHVTKGGLRTMTVSFKRAANGQLNFNEPDLAPVFAHLQKNYGMGPYKFERAVVEAAQREAIREAYDRVERQCVSFEEATTQIFRARPNLMRIARAETVTENESPHVFIDRMHR